MSLFKCLVGGLVGGLIGGIIWVVIGYFSGYEVGYIAWGVGFLVGLGVRLAAQDEGGFVPGFASVGIAVLSILAAKYFVATLLVSSLLATHNFSVTVTDDMLITGIAKDVVLQVLKTGQPLTWPNGGSILTAESKPDFPPAIWAEAENRWNALPPAERESRRTLAQAKLKELESNIRSNAFSESFSLWDLLWFGLAAFTAFKVGSGLTSSND